MHSRCPWPRNTEFQFSLRTGFAESVWRVRHEKTPRNLQAREYLLDHIRVARTSVFRILTFFRKPRCRIPALQKENGAWFGACSGEALRNSDRQRTAGFLHCADRKPSHSKALQIVPTTLIESRIIQ